MAAGIVVSSDRWLEYVDVCCTGQSFLESEVTSGKREPARVASAYCRALQDARSRWHQVARHNQKPRRRWKRLFTCATY